MKEPKEGEFVVCKIKKVNPHSVFAELIEYNEEGMIHISELTRGWVKDIKKHVKIGQIVVAKIVGIRGESISLSLKRVGRSQEKEKLKEFKLEQKANKMMDVLGKTYKLPSDKIKEKLEEEFGSLYEGFKLALKNEEILKEKGLDKKWIEAIKKVAEKNFAQKEFEIKAELILKTYKSGGIDIIKKKLKSLEKEGLNVKYISAPKYLVTKKTKNVKKDKKDFSIAIEKILKDKDVEGEFKIL